MHNPLREEMTEALVALKISSKHASTAEVQLSKSGVHIASPRERNATKHFCVTTVQTSGKMPLPRAKGEFWKKKERVHTYKS